MVIGFARYSKQKQCVRRFFGIKLISLPSRNARNSFRNGSFPETKSDSGSKWPRNACAIDVFWVTLLETGIYNSFTSQASFDCQIFPCQFACFCGEKQANNSPVSFDKGWCSRSFSTGDEQVYLYCSCHHLFGFASVPPLPTEGDTIVAPSAGYCWAFQHLFLYQLKQSPTPAWQWEQPIATQLQRSIIL